jgi:hypothetical protein
MVCLCLSFESACVFDAVFSGEAADDSPETYRKAAKLDPTSFTTNFHPHDHGILQDIERVLLPAFEKGLKLDSTIFVQAELYKLNVFSTLERNRTPRLTTPRCTPGLVESSRLMWTRRVL